LTTSDPRSSSEELGLQLPAGQSAPKGPEIGQRETAPRLQRNRCRPAALRHAPKGRTPHQGAPPGPSRDPFPSPSTPRRSEDHLSASTCLNDPKTASTYRELASEPQDPVATTYHAPTPRRTMKRRRQVRRDPADRAACRLPPPGEPEGPPGELAASVSALGAHQHRPFTAQLRLRRGSTRRQRPAPSSLGTRSLRRHATGQLRRASRQRKPSLPRTRCSPLSTRTGPPDPEGTGAGPSDHAGRVRTPCRTYGLP
jgi:hypothetical protein